MKTKTFCDSPQNVGSQSVEPSLSWDVATFWDKYVLLFVTLKSFNNWFLIFNYFFIFLLFYLEKGRKKKLSKQKNKRCIVSWEFHWQAGIFLLQWDWNFFFINLLVYLFINFYIYNFSIKVLLALSHDCWNINRIYLYYIFWEFIFWQKKRNF